MEETKKELKKEYKKLYKALKNTNFKRSGNDIKLSVEEHETLDTIVNAIAALRAMIKNDPEKGKIG